MRIISVKAGVCAQDVLVPVVRQRWKEVLEELRYWSVSRQEAYASAEIATRRYLETEGRR